MEEFESLIADELCGDDSFCRFDIIVTGRADIAMTTLQGSKRVDLVANLSLPGICIIPYEHILCIHDTVDLILAYSIS